MIGSSVRCAHLSCIPVYDEVTFKTVIVKVMTFARFDEQAAAVSRLESAVLARASKMVGGTNTVIASTSTLYDRAVEPSLFCFHHPSYHLAISNMPKIWHMRGGISD